MTERNAHAIRQHRARQRTKGLRAVQLWLPDTSSREFSAQVARDIATLAKLNPDDEAMLRAFERMAEENLSEWS